LINIADYQRMALQLTSEGTRGGGGGGGGGGYYAFLHCQNTINRKCNCVSVDMFAMSNDVVIFNSSRTNVEM